MCKKLIYLVSFILLLGLVFAGGAKAADPNLVGWWPLNEGSGDIAVDLSGSGNDGTISNLNGGLGPRGSVWVDDPERGMVISFDGDDSGAYVSTPGKIIPAMSLDNDFTWALWAKQHADQETNNDVILGNRYGGTTSPLQFIKFTPTRFEFFSDDYDYLEAVNYEPVPGDEWVHHMTVKDGTSLTYYRNGIEAGTSTITKTIDENPLYMGGDVTAEHWQGYMSDVRIYNKALTGLEILAVMKGVERIDMEIGFAMQTPVIDGEVEEIWAGASTQSFVPLDDPANASGSWKALYDAVNLYVIIDISDDSLMNDSASSWQDDSVEVYFDGGNTKLNTPLSGDDHQYTFGWTTDEIQGNNFEGYTEGIEHAQVDTDTGWRIEIKLPWLSIQGAEPQAGDLIGIDCYYNDDDDGGDSRENKLLSFSAVEGWNDASQWGTAILTAEAAAEGPKIIWVGDAHDLANPGGPPDDQGWVDLLEANGYIVDYKKNTPGSGPWQGDLSANQISALNRADLVIISRDASTAGHNRPDAWNSIEAPVLSLNNYMARSSRWQWVNSTAINARQEYYDLKADDPEHPIFAGVELDPNSQVVWFDPAAGSGYASFFDTNDVGNGSLIASRPDNGNLLIVEWEAGVPFYEGTDQIPAGKRMLFCAANQEDSGNVFFGAYNLSAEGEKMFLNAVEYMIPVKPVDPGSDGLAAYYALENDVLDGSGNGNDGTIVGNPTYVEGPAGYGTAMEFHGLGAPGGGGDYIDCGNDASLDIAGPISIALWIRPGADDPEGQGTETAPMAKAMSGISPWNWQVRYGWGSPQPYMAFTFNTSPRAWAYVGKNLERNEWCHIACSHDGATLKCYLDGVETDSTPMGEIAQGEAPVLIGSDGWGCDWIGAIDEVAIYNRALSADEILELAAVPEAPRTVVYDFETDAQGWGDLKDGTATTVVGETHAGGGSQSLRSTIDETAHGQEQGGWASSRDFTADDAAGGISTLSFWYRADDPDMNGGNFVFHWIMSTEAWSGGGWYGNGLWGVLIADGQWHQQTVDLSILGEAAGGWEGTWGDQTAWDFRDDLLYSFEILFEPTDNTTTGSNIYIDDVVFSGP